eukprot:CAMPEP_0184499374 /NCGR_PEP_ID=MMETSP0113_2-20130426/41327_1 /TAXON_ID=91329 /ORGANISM="Norrisiella sphaerica, Strain BC52" /LENGTH=523 /DNA_ID=CAMNT_0026887263 /DNA_START=236 /DNA_END=1803 /DNA_ORIENTATION=+
MSNIHVDIPCTQINSWLCNRGKLKKKWQSDLRALQARVKEAMKALDVNIQEQIEGDGLGYSEVLNVLKALESQQEASGEAVKTMFGGYNSDLLKSWDEIRKAFLQDNLYLADSGRTLAQKVKYDIPRMRKLIQESGRQISDLSRKVSDKRQQSKDWRDKFKAKCEELGVQGVDVPSELRSTLSGLPAALEVVSKCCHETAVGEAMALYRDYTNFLNSYMREQRDGKESSEGKSFKGYTPTLAELTTVREAPAYDFKAAAKASENLSREVENGWSIVESKEAAAKPEASDVKGVKASSGEEIDWDFDVEEQGGVSEEKGNAEDADNDWDITVDETADTSHQASGKNGAKDNAGCDFKQSRRQKHILENEMLRNGLANNLLELSCFLKHRLTELEDGDPIGAGQYSRRDQANLELARRSSLVPVTRCLKAVDACLEALKDSGLERMLLIQNSERYVTRLADSILQLDRNANKALEAITKLEARQQTVRNSVDKITESLSRAEKTSKELQEMLETTLMKMFPEAAG